MTTLLSDLTYRLKEYWVAPPSAMALQDAGALARSLQKGPPSGTFASMKWNGTGDGLMSITTQGSGNVGSGKATAYANAKTEGGVRGTARAARYYSYFRMDEDELSMVLQSYDGDVGAATVMEKMEMTRQNYWRAKSAYLWHDGRGGVAALASTSGVGTTITLVNRNQVRAFEIGDVLVGYDPAVYDAACTVTALGVPATPRTLTVTVTGRNEDAGTLTLNAAWSTLGAGAGAAGDIVGHSAWRPATSSSNLDRAGLYGLRTWVAWTTAEQAVTALGINRATDPGRSAGRLITTLTAGTPTYEVIRSINESADRYGINYDVLYCPTEETTDLDRHFENQRSVPPDFARGIFGMSGFKSRRRDGGEATIVSDPYLWDYRTNDRIFIAHESEQVGIVTDQRNIRWSTEGRPGGSNGLINTDGLGDLSAQYGMVGQLCNANPSRTIVVRVPRS
jgi:hypothetical protein